MQPVIICVDDENIVLSSLEKELRGLLQEEFEIEIAESGQEALAVIDELIAEKRNIALVISDYVMPIMNGGELLEIISQKTPDTSTLLLTGHAEIHDISQTINKSRLDKFLTKPWDKDELAACVTSLTMAWQIKHDLKIHQAKSAERYLALELIAQVAKTGSFKWIPATKKIEFTTQWLGTFGYNHKIDTNEDFYFSLIHPDDQKIVKKTYNDLANGKITKSTFEFRIKDASGKWRWVTNNSIADISDSINVICIEQDITEHKHNEQLLINADKTTKVLENIQEQISYISPDLKVIWANRNEDGSACNESGFHCYNQWGEGKPCTNCPVKKSLATGKSEYSEVVMDNGKIFSSTASPVFNDDNEIIGIVHTRLDITRQKELEIELQHNKKMESVGQLASGIAHELNTPIQYISDNLSFLKRTFDLLQDKINEQVEQLDHQQIEIDQLTEYLKSMFNNEYELKEATSAFEDAIHGTNHIAKIVSAMKDFTHPDGNSPESADLNLILNNAKTITKNEWKYIADVELNFEDEMLNISCMPGSLLQVFINMIVNSAHAIEERKAVDDFQGIIKIETKRKDHDAIVIISDNGMGIPKDVIDNVFDPFFTTKEVGKGTGQGLAITHNIITSKHGGSIKLESTHGNGTTFIITIPVIFAGKIDENEEQNLETLSLI